MRRVKRAPSNGRPKAGAWLRRIATVAGFALIPGLLTPVVFAADGPLGAPKLSAPHSAEVSPFTAEVNKKHAAAMKKIRDARRKDRARAKRDQTTAVTWPNAGSATLAVPDTGTAKATPGSLPLTLTASTGKRSRSGGAVKVRVLDQKQSAELGIKGVVLAVTGPPTGGSAQLGINYSKFASAYGGDWAGRLQALRLPQCALTDPTKAHCRGRDSLESTNDRASATLDTRLTFAPGAGDGQSMVLALAAGTESGAGDYKATPLAASSTWEAGGSSGTFTWSYPLRTPPAAAGPQPGLSISYDSGSVDGRTASTNNQGTSIGEGFDITSSYIERRYGSCDDDGQDDKYDLCWKYDNASLVLNGKASELVKDDTKAGTPGEADAAGAWRLKNDDASTVTHSTGSDNGDDNGETWTVTTGEGTKYVFGLNKLEGAGATERTQSVWTVPVFGDDSGEPGYGAGSSFADRDKKQAWRWNLDYVEDPHGNAMTYWYTAEGNNYDKLGDDNTGTSYIRGGQLKEIRYGQRKGALFSGSPAASDKVTFSYAERCVASVTGCDSLTEDTRDNWPDVPFDSLCKDGDKCTGHVSPTFFSRKRMTGITTSAWNATATPTPAFEDVESWVLKQHYLDPGDTGDSSDQSLWLDEIRHTGKHGSELTLPAVTFGHEFLANRVDGTDNILPLNRPRLAEITSETGAETLVSYMPADCSAAQAKPAVDTNSKRCYPVYWSPDGGKIPILDWFQKYPVAAVSTTDPKGGSEAVEHAYTYSGGGAWHYNDDPLTKEKERTWSSWRGFGQVTHYTGRPDKTRSKTVTVYLRGMNGDRVLSADGKTLDPTRRKVVAITGVKAAAVTDADQYAGFTRESVTYNGSQEVGGQINDPWSAKTATQHKSYADTEAYFVRTAASHTRSNITTGGTAHDRVRTTTTAFDSYGMAKSVEDRGDDAVAGDEKCTRTWYARNDSVGINNLVARTRIVAEPCATSDAELDLPGDSTRPGDVISDVAFAFDTTTWSPAQAPTKGEAKWTGRAKSYGTDDQPAWQKAGTTTYDALGRPLTVKDTNDTLTSTTAYTPAATGPLTTTVATNAKGHLITTKMDFATGAALKVTDANGKASESTYDSLGRVTQTWLANSPRSLGKRPNYVYNYSITADDLPWVSTGTLKGDGSGYNTSYEIYDSQLRPRQTQAPSPVGGRQISLTLYDERGLAVSSQSDIWDAGSEPTSEIVQTEGSQAPVQTDTTYDGAGRVTKAITMNFGATRWSTENNYTGDTVTTTAPTGGQATAAVSDIFGRTTQHREYAGPQPTGTAFTTTEYTYRPGGQQAAVTGPDGTRWTYTYDLFGRQASTTDPDKGTSTTAYNELDQVVSTTDSRNKKLISEYDELGRRIGLWNGTKTDTTKLAAWTFDTPAKGLPGSSVRYDGGLNGEAYTSKITAYDAVYHVTGSQLTLPADDPLVGAGVPATLNSSAVFNLDGTTRQYSNPAVAGLPAETVRATYNSLGQQVTASGTSGYLQAGLYSELGDLRQLTLATDPKAGKNVYLAYGYEPGTRRLKSSFVSDDVHTGRPQDLNFTQDDAGNVTSVFDTPSQAGVKADHQCFTYDGNRRLAEAWTPKPADCTISGRTTDNLDGAAPYWTSYTYTASGQRKTEAQHTASGVDTTTYAYGTTAGQPHPLVQTTGEDAATYTYDKTGNTTGRPGVQAAQTLAWNSEGKLVSATEPAAGTKPATGTSYLYDASGELLISRNTSGDGDTVLYLGGSEVRLTTKGTTKTLAGTRYYSAAGQTIAVRTATAGVAGTKLCFMAGDHHGTSSLFLDATTLAITKRYMTPFGSPRGVPAADWPDDKAFLGKTADSATGLTHIGAREYDPALGQFLSVDPLLETDKAQTLNGYSYSINNPLTFSDPTGMGLACGGAGGSGEGCPNRPDGSAGNGRPNEAVDYDKPWVHYPPNDGGTAPTTSTGSTGGNQGCGFWDIMCGTKRDVAFVDEVFYGLVGNVAYSSEYFGWLGDSDCWNGGTGVPGCDYGSQYDDWVASQGINTSSDAYLVPSFLVAMFTANPETAAASGGTVKVPGGKHGASKGVNCFLAGTMVLMADGEAKKIEAIEVGEKVIASDPETGITEKRKVTQLIVTEGDKEFSELSIATRGGPEKLTATSGHPFWSPSEHRWLDAGELKSGMTLRAVDGSAVAVKGSRTFTKRVRTYNLTVEGLHTYYVLAGATAVLVHNTCGYDPEFPTIKLENYRGRFNASLNKNGIKRLPDDWDAHHAIPQEYRNHPGFSGFDFDAPSNMRGVPGSRMKSRGANVHQEITNQWKWFGDTNPNPSRAQVENFAGQIDRGYGAYFWGEPK